MNERLKTFEALKSARWLSAEEIGVSIQALRALQQEGWLEVAYPYELYGKDIKDSDLLWHIRDHRRERARKELKGE